MFVVGPRDYVVDKMLGKAGPLEDYVTSCEDWVWLTPSSSVLDFPELWVDKIHDFVWEEDGD